MIDNDNIDIGGGWNPATGMAGPALAPSVNPAPVPTPDTMKVDLNDSSKVDEARNQLKEIATQVANGDVSSLVSGDILKYVPKDVILKKYNLQEQRLLKGEYPKDPQNIGSAAMTAALAGNTMMNDDAEQGLGFGQILKKALTGGYRSSPDSIAAQADKVWAAALASGAGYEGAAKAFVKAYETGLQKVQSKQVDLAFKPIEQAQQIATNDKLYGDIRTQTMKRMGGNLSKYADKYGITPDEVNKAQQLLQMAIETEDYTGVQQRAAQPDVGLDKPWFRQLLLKTQMEIAQREQELTKLTGRQANNHITAGNQIAWYDKDGKVAAMGQRATLNGQPVITLDDRPNQPLSPDEIQNMNTKYGMYQDAAKGITATTQREAASTFGKKVAETTEKADVAITDLAEKATARIADNEGIRSILSGELKTGLIQAESNPLVRQALTAMNEGVKVGNYDIRLPIAELKRAGLSQQAIADAELLDKYMAKKVFGAVQSAGFKGAQSDAELKQIRQSVPTTGNTTDTINMMLILDDAAAKVDQRIAQEWDKYRDAMLDAGRTPDYTSWARKNKDNIGNDIVKQAKEQLDAYRANMKKEPPAAPSAPGSKTQGGGVSGGKTSSGRPFTINVQ
jgi:hypothetical protein